MASYTNFLPLLQEVEGGYQNIPQDTGNYNSLGQNAGTNYGISAKFYESVLGRPPTADDMKAITKNKAAKLFRIYYWDNLQADKINSQAVANSIVDHHVNSQRGVRVAQQTLNEKFGYSLAVDNVMGPQTLAALNAVGNAFLGPYNDARETYYRSLNNPTFQAGWLSRLDKFRVGSPSTPSKKLNPFNGDTNKTLLYATLGVMGLLFIFKPR